MAPLEQGFSDMVSPGAPCDCILTASAVPSFFVYTVGRPALGKTRRLPVLPAPPSWAHPPSPWWPLLPIECHALPGNVPSSCPVSHPLNLSCLLIPYKQENAFPFGASLHWWELSIATNRKMHEPAYPTGEFLIGCRDVSRTSRAGSCWVSKAGIADYRALSPAPLLLLMGFLLFFSSVSMTYSPLWDPYGKHTIKQAK